MFRWLILFCVILLIEFYSYQAVKTVVKSKWIIGAYLLLSLLIIAYVLFFIFSHNRGDGQNKESLFTIGLLLITVLPKIVITVLLFGEDVFRFFSGAIAYFSNENSEGDSFLPERRKFVSQVALGLAAIPFSSLLYGMTIGKYNYKVIKQTLFFPDLPSDFDGTRITHISDIHSGSFDNPEKIEYAIDLINEQKSELVLFTGDIVNTHAKEMDPWIDSFKRIESNGLGKFSVLGNHDYGEYFKWNSKEEKQANFEAIKVIHEKIGFKLLLNQNVRLRKGQSELTLIGVENWGKHFKKAGDLAIASKGVKREDFKILMSHDPSHWDAEIQHDDNHYHLTLSGHTHGFQFGIEIPGWIKWSPVQYVYKQWAGLYENFGRYIYVNRGFGFHAYPGRVGIMPEITVIELKKGGYVA